MNTISSTLVTDTATVTGLSGYRVHVINRGGTTVTAADTVVQPGETAELSLRDETESLALSGAPKAEVDVHYVPTNAPEGYFSGLIAA